MICWLRTAGRHAQGLQNQEGNDFTTGKVGLLHHVIFVVLFVLLFGISVKDQGVLSEISKPVGDNNLFLVIKCKII